MWYMQEEMQPYLPEIQPAQQQIQPTVAPPVKKNRIIIVIVAIVIVAILIMIYLLLPATSPLSMMKDSDGDGYNDSIDDFPNDATEHSDFDGDGVGDNSDVFPNDSTEWEDTDSDGYGDNSDAFPDDSTEHLDTDGDGYGDNSDAYPNDVTKHLLDTDGDGYDDDSDAFPNDPTEHADTDGDGHGDNSDAFPSNPAEWDDTDGDGYGDNSDKFPTDPLEWNDADNDGYGDNSDPLPNDHDNDGFNDAVDLKPDFDAGILITIDYAEVIDQVDFLSSYADVYFQLWIDGTYIGRIDSDGYVWTLQVGTTYIFDESYRYNVDDDTRYTTISIAMLDEDWLSADDYIDIDGTSQSLRMLDVTFDLSTGTWSGDDTDGFVDGSLDGTSSSDDDDGALWYSISVCSISSTKTYSWDFDGYSYQMTVNVPTSSYYQYKTMSVDRQYYLLDSAEIDAFVTSTDSTVANIATTLANKAASKGYTPLKTANFVLTFVLSIKYTYDNVSEGPNDYWRFPVETLYDETGDCEDTAILFASIMEAMGYDAIILILPGHCAVGLDVSGATGTYYSVFSKQYYYCETAGDAGDWVVGKIPSEYISASATCYQVS
jgi:hypothetical protein